MRTALTDATQTHVAAAGSTAAQAATEHSSFWAPFSRLDRRQRDRVAIVRGEGSRVWDADGRVYLDATASLWYANVGHGRRRIGDAAAEQMARLASYSNFGDFTTEPAERLTSRIASLAPLDDPLVFLTSGGSDAVDSGVKIARRFWQLRGQTDRSVIISRRRSYHGMHGFGTALAGIPENGRGYGSDLAPGFVRVPENDADALGDRIREIGPDRVAAIFVEPVIGAGGVVPPEPGYLTEVRRLCDEYGILFVADEVITGFGRLGTWFGSERFAIRPDLLLMAKGLTSGYLPLGGVVVARQVWEEFHASHEVFRHGYTYSGHAAACAAAMANLDILEEENLLSRVKALEPQLAASMASLSDHDLVSEVRHIGLLAAIQLPPDKAHLVAPVVAAARDHGVLTRALAGGALQVSPPFVVEPDELQELATGLRATLDQVTAAHG